MKQHGLKGHQVQESKGAIFIPMVSSKAKIPSKSRSKLLSPKACGVFWGNIDELKHDMRNTVLRK